MVTERREEESPGGEEKARKKRNTLSLISWCGQEIDLLEGSPGVWYTPNSRSEPEGLELVRVELKSFLCHSLVDRH